MGRELVPAVDLEKQAFDDLRDQIREVIIDPGRATEAIALVTVLSNDPDQLREKIAIRRAKALDLNANYDATRAEFASLLTEANVAIRGNYAQALKNHRAFLRLTTQSKRKLFSKAHTQALQASIQSIQAIERG